MIEVLCKTPKNFGLLFVISLIYCYRVYKMLFSISIESRNVGVANGHYRRQQLDIPADITLGFTF